jgi:hypothetical protein
MFKKIIVYSVLLVTSVSAQLKFEDLIGLDQVLKQFMAITLRSKQSEKFSQWMMTNLSKFYENFNETPLF